MSPPITVPLAEIADLPLAPPPALPVQPAQPSVVDKVKAIVCASISWLRATIYSTSILLTKVIAKSVLIAQPLAMTISANMSHRLVFLQPTIAYAAREGSKKAFELLPVVSIGGLQLNGHIGWQLAEKAGGFIWMNWPLVVNWIAFACIFLGLFLWFLYFEGKESCYNYFTYNPSVF